MGRGLRTRRRRRHRRHERRNRVGPKRLLCSRVACKHEPHTHQPLLVFLVYHSASPMRAQRLHRAPRDLTRKQQEKGRPEVIHLPSQSNLPIGHKREAPGQAAAETLNAEQQPRRAGDWHLPTPQGDGFRCRDQHPRKQNHRTTHRSGEPFGRRVTPLLRHVSTWHRRLAPIAGPFDRQFR